MSDTYWSTPYRGHWIQGNVNDDHEDVLYVLFNDLTRYSVPNISAAKAVIDTRVRLGDEMWEALMEFKREHGRNWKTKLRTLWVQGKDEGVLRQVRNAYGNLDRVRLP